MPLTPVVRDILSGVTVAEPLARMILHMEAYFLGRFLLEAAVGFRIPGEVVRVTRVRVVGQSSHAKLRRTFWNREVGLVRASWISNRSHVSSTS